MPWCEKAMKDVASCDKPRVGAHNYRSEDFRMGKPDPIRIGSPSSEYIAGWSERGELVYKQATVPNSNIIELVNDVLRQKSSDRAVGWREFASGLGSASVKISRDLITNNDSWKIIEGRSSSTDDVVNLSSIFQETTPARRSAATRQSRELTSTKRKPKRQQRYGTWVEY